MHGIHHDELIRAIGEERREAAARWAGRGGARAAPRFWKALMRFARWRVGPAVAAPVSLGARSGGHSDVECCAAETPAA